jgi:hypothetical protein
MSRSLGAPPGPAPAAAVPAAARRSSGPRRRGAPPDARTTADTGGVAHQVALRAVARLVFTHAFAEEAVLFPAARRVLPEATRPYRSPWPGRDRRRPDTDARSGCVDGRDHGNQHGRPPPRRVRHAPAVFRDHGPPRPAHLPSSRDRGSGLARERVDAAARSPIARVKPAAGNDRRSGHLKPRSRFTSTGRGSPYLVRDPWPLGSSGGLCSSEAPMAARPCAACQTTISATSDASATANATPPTASRAA